MLVRLNPLSEIHRNHTRDYLGHFVEEEAEAQKSDLMFARPHNEYRKSQGLTQVSLAPKYSCPHHS